ncbi:hypothetical protein EXIGLDRAFT_310605 [Exidia glandulosa HHB12029]|uniref:Uncharacterized protein n=1 Tax=Exidia glandulosa HHB12029 TaxID=1314781 RepID=A0A165D073_EXIGL|nr:hypothetical protein EXIGLDRAFT_310605 [Exidia glandulosa HHB12029]
MVQTQLAHAPIRDSRIIIKPTVIPSHAVYEGYGVGQRQFSVYNNGRVPMQPSSSPPSYTRAPCTKAMEFVSDSSPRTTMDAYRFNVRSANSRAHVKKLNRDGCSVIKPTRAPCPKAAESVRDSFRGQQMDAYQPTSPYDARTSRSSFATDASSSSPPSYPRAPYMKAVELVSDSSPRTTMDAYRFTIRASRSSAATGASSSNPPSSTRA